MVLAVRAELHRELARRLRVALRTPLALSNVLTTAVLLTCAMCRQLPGTESQYEESAESQHLDPCSESGPVSPPGPHWAPPAAHQAQSVLEVFQ